MSNADRPSEYTEDARQNASNQMAIGAIDERGRTHDVFKDRDQVVGDYKVVVTLTSKD